MTLLDTLRFLNTFFAGIAAGTWVVTQMALIPARKGLAQGGAIALFLGTEAGITRFNPLCAATSGISALLILTLDLSPTSTSALLTAVSCVGIAGASLISILWNMPIRRKIASWPVGSISPEYAAIQQRWDLGNLARAALGLMAFASSVLSIL
jgi:hypothetical protein